MVKDISCPSKSYLVSHQELERLVAHFVADIRQGKARWLFLNYFAPAGFGKTALLEQLWEQYERILPTSFVSVTAFWREDQAFALRDLLMQVICDLDRHLPRRITSLPDSKQFPDKTKLAELIIDLVEDAGDSGEVTLLLFDDYDAMPAEDSHWLESRILSELGKTRAVGVILTSQLELRFLTSFDLRRELKSYELPALSTEAISRSLPQYAEVAAEIRRITGGVPASVEELIRQLEASHIKTGADFRSRKQELIRKYYQTYVRETILQTIPVGMRETILALALLRRFDVMVLRGILPKVLPGYYRGYGAVDYLGLIERVGSQVQWRAQGGYALNQALRLLLQGYVLAEEQEFYKQVNRAAVVLYGELLKREYREYYLVELLYHKLALLKFERDSDLSSIQTKMGQELFQCLNGDEAVLVRETDLDSLRYSLAKDPDLKDYITKDVVLTTPNLIRVHFSRAVLHSEDNLPFRYS